ncbi:Uncharacterised protein [Bordetella pertussis]|nr:Uncharacterised protein [Bordetella pertussis]CPK93680.1 Uncharacterised protein [Bordetella pertussis]CPL60472.1 Uncharacterised protein [Bordetella pertussis]CPM77286.1 Uncharacterised protein [Bordetella pertussis]
MRWLTDGCDMPSCSAAPVKLAVSPDGDQGAQLTQGNRFDSIHHNVASCRNSSNTIAIWA